MKANENQALVNHSGLNSNGIDVTTEGYGFSALMI